MKTIFIAVGAYNEPYIKLMIDNCLENAEFPTRVHFGLWLHNNDNVHLDLSEYSNVKVAYLQYPSLLGVPPARLNSIGLYDDEDYYFQVDGHMLFEKHWDTKVINKFEELRKTFDKPIITTYTPWWSMTGDTINFYSNESKATCSPMFLDFEGSVKEGYPKPTTRHLTWGEDELYKEHHFISAHFLFTLPSFIEDVLPDPLIMYSGEEVTTAVRAWTRGYRMVCIQNPIAWHLNKFHGDRYEKDRLWDVEQRTSSLFAHWWRKNDKGMARSKRILTGDLVGYWGAESQDILQKYEEASGVSFSSLYESINKKDV
jgi:hypothetical protein